MVPVVLGDKGDHYFPKPWYLVKADEKHNDVCSCLVFEAEDLPFVTLVKQSQASALNYRELKKMEFWTLSNKPFHGPSVPSVRSSWYPP